MAIRFAGFGRDRDELFPLAALLPASGPLADACEVFQSDQTVGMGVQEVLGNRMVDAQLKPSLSLPYGDASLGG